MEQGFYLSGLSKEELLDLIKQAVKEGTKEEYNKLSTDKLLTQDEASKFLSASKTTLIDWAKKGKISPTRVGGRIYYRKSDLLNINSKKG